MKSGPGPYLHGQAHSDGHHAHARLHQLGRWDPGHHSDLHGHGPAKALHRHRTEGGPELRGSSELGGRRLLLFVGSLVPGRGGFAFLGLRFGFGGLGGHCSPGKSGRHLSGYACNRRSLVLGRRKQRKLKTRKRFARFKVPSMGVGGIFSGGEIVDFSTSS